MPEKRIDQYRHLKEVAHGGMGTVYSATNENGQKVAIKILDHRLTQDGTVKKRFKREAKIISKLKNPAVVRILDYSLDGHEPYIVMRFMADGSLADRLERGPLSLDETAFILSQICPALDEAHSKKIIHRDLKPGNILFDSRYAYLADFGIAGFDDEESPTLTKTGESFGTPAYMSPEQIDDVKNVTYRTDIYSLGVIVFEMLTGQVPFSADTPYRLMRLHLQEAVPKVSEIKKGLPEGCQEIINRAMEKNPDKRYASATELANDLNLLAREKSGGKERAGVARVLQNKKVTLPKYFGRILIVTLLLAVIGFSLFSIVSNIDFGNAADGAGVAITADPVTVENTPAPPTAAAESPGPIGFLVNGKGDRTSFLLDDVVAVEENQLGSIQLNPGSGTPQESSLLALDGSSFRFTTVEIGRITLDVFPGTNLFVESELFTGVVGVRLVDSEAIQLSGVGVCMAVRYGETGGSAVFQCYGGQCGYNVGEDGTETLTLGQQITFDLASGESHPIEPIPATDIGSYKDALTGFPVITRAEGCLARQPGEGSSVTNTPTAAPSMTLTSTETPTPTITETENATPTRTPAPVVPTLLPTWTPVPPTAVPQPTSVSPTSAPQPTSPPPTQEPPATQVPNTNTPVPPPTDEPPKTNTPPPPPK